MFLKLVKLSLLSTSGTGWELKARFGQEGLRKSRGIFGGPLVGVGEDLKVALIRHSASAADVPTVSEHSLCN